MVLTYGQYLEGRQRECSTLRIGQTCSLAGTLSQTAPTHASKTPPVYQPFARAENKQIYSGGTRHRRTSQIRAPFQRITQRRVSATVVCPAAAAAAATAPASGNNAFRMAAWVDFLKIHFNFHEIRSNSEGDTPRCALNAVNVALRGTARYGVTLCGTARRYATQRCGMPGVRWVSFYTQLTTLTAGGVALRHRSVRASRRRAEIEDH